MYSVRFSKGWHRLACNHLVAPNTKHGQKFPAIHPLVDKYIRKRVEMHVKSGRHLNLVYAEILDGLVDHIRKTPALFCNLPHADERYDATLDKNRHMCRHAMTHAFLATISRFSKAAQMVPVKHMTVDVRSEEVAHVQSTDVWSSIQRMLVVDGHSDMGCSYLCGTCEKSSQICIA